MARVSTSTVVSIVKVDQRSHLLHETKGNVDNASKLKGTEFPSPLRM
jgi:hypothetical protein